MVFLLNQTNVFDYLADLGYRTEQSTKNVELISAKNFNLLVTLLPKLQMLIKQERHHEGKAVGEFAIEWQVQKLIREFPELAHWRSFLPKIEHFDVENSILVLKYLQDYQDLMKFHMKDNSYPAQIAAQIGVHLATIHRDTYHQQHYRQAMVVGMENPKNTSQVQQLIRNIEWITPEIFASVPDDALKFYSLYQRFDSLRAALAELGEAFVADCLTHNDLKLNNILLHNNWEQPGSEIVRLIDWERSAWGDPAYDLGTVIGSYLQMWLGSLVVSQSLSIEESLSLAMTPLDRVQPSIASLTRAYLATFPEIIANRPDLIERAIQFAGLTLIQGIVATIDYQKTFGNSGIASLQVAKTLLCRPAQSMSTVFGTLEFTEQLAVVG